MIVSTLGPLAQTAASAGFAVTALVLVILVGGACLAAWLIVSARAARHGAGSLFAGLCQAHELTSSDRRLLHRLAQWRGLADPARLFVEPRYFEAASFNPALGAQADRLAALRQQLFGA